MSAPTFHLDDDGKHVVWEHDCLLSWGELERIPMRIPINAEHGWTVVSTDPITLTPSLLCTGCGTHGFITDGRWVGV
jgi:hypothetical protein